MEREGPWTTPSDLAEYTFCPRAHYYRRQQEEPRTPAAAAGESYHRRRLSAERWRDEHPALLWLALAVGLVLLAVAAGLSGLR